MFIVGNRGSGVLAALLIAAGFTVLSAGLDALAHAAEFRTSRASACPVRAVADTSLRPVDHRSQALREPCTHPNFPISYLQEYPIWN
jgi:hypothetical protein